jgi:hypothetical protein
LITWSATASTPAGMVRSIPLGSTEVDDEFEFGWRLNRHVCWFFALEDAIEGDPGAASESQAISNSGTSVSRRDIAFFSLRGHKLAELDEKRVQEKQWNAAADHPDGYLDRKGIRDAHGVAKEFN